MLIGGLGDEERRDGYGGRGSDEMMTEREKDEWRVGRLKDVRVLGRALTVDSLYP